MIIDSNKTVFGVNADCIVNTINCVGFMGKGLALEFALRYPELESIYKKQCANKEIKTGHVYFYNIDGQKIINFPTKFHFKYPSKIEWIKLGLQDFKNNYKFWDIKSIAFPILGGRNGGLNHDEVCTLIREYLGDLDIDVYICHATEVDDLDVKMINDLISVDLDKMANDLNLNSKTIEALRCERKHIRRFSDLRDIKGFGNETYKKVFRYIKNEEFNDTVSLF